MSRSERRNCMNQIRTPAIDTSAIPWPEDGLEYIEACPVCGETNRSILYENLVDNVFRCAPGKWSMWRCSGCESAYLNPRPTLETIHIAYQSYYTHSVGEARREFGALGLGRRLRRRLSNGYANWRYGTQRTPATKLGIALALMCPPLTSIVDRAFRHLPRKREIEVSLLDVGCGNGEFLSTASEAGWRVMGIDPDPKAVAEVAKKGFKVSHGGIDVLCTENDVFDFISLSHVIEHVHEPQIVLKACYRLLKPGGYLWIETPNINSFGHFLLRNKWYPLDPPRHLSLFNHSSLRTLLSSIGFDMLATPWQLNECSTKIYQSFGVSMGKSLYDSVKVPSRLRMLGLAGDMWETFVKTSHEAILIRAQKPLQ